MPAPQALGHPARAIALIGMGANIGEPRVRLEAAFVELAQLPGTKLLRRSAFYRTSPVGWANQPDFINAAASIATALAPRALLDALLAIERRHGRRRRAQDGANTPRPLDLDLLLHGDCIIAEAGLVVPHPRMHERRFVLEPVVEIAPDCAIPGLGLARDWLARVQQDKLAAGQTVERIT